MRKESFLLTNAKLGGMIREFVTKSEAEAEAQQKLRAELEGMTLSAVKKRAKQVGVDAGKLEEAYDAGDVQSALIELIVDDKSRDQPESSGTAAIRAAGSSCCGLCGSGGCCFGSRRDRRQQNPLRSDTSYAAAAREDSQTADRNP